MIVGSTRAGKDTVAMVIKHLLGDHSLPHFSFSSPVGDVLDIFDMPHDGEHITEFTAALSGTRYGQSIFRRALLKKIREAETYSPRAIIVSGGKSAEDLEILRAYKGWLVGVEASILVRYERAGCRKGESIAFREFVKSDRAAAEGEIASLLARADIVFRNDANGFLSLYDQVRAWLPADI